MNQPDKKQASNLTAGISDAEKTISKFWPKEEGGTIGYCCS
jgi:hypothetical protein